MDDFELHIWPPRQSTGGQQVADMRTGVLVLHVPTGIAVVADDGSRIKSRTRAMERLEQIVRVKEQGNGDSTGIECGVSSGPGSHRKPGGIIGAPYLDGVQHLAFPEVRP